MVAQRDQVLDSKRKLRISSLGNIKILMGIHCALMLNLQELSAGPEGVNPRPRSRILLATSCVLSISGASLASVPLFNHQLRPVQKQNTLIMGAGVSGVSGLTWWAWAAGSFPRRAKKGGDDEPVVHKEGAD